MTSTVVIATMWTGAVIIKPVAEPPSAAELDAIATTLAPQNGGVRPTVRVVERLTFGSA